MILDWSTEKFYHKVSNHLESLCQLVFAKVLGLCLISYLSKLISRPTCDFNRAFDVLISTKSMKVDAGADQILNG